MPIEPLRTDEQVPNAKRKARDMDALMLAGCTGFVGTSFVAYALVVWPFFLFQDSERLRSLGICAGLGMIPSLIVGAIATRRMGLSGACGFVGGSMATAIFLFLRLQGVFIGARARQAPEADYPSQFVYLVPLGWILLALLTATLLMPRGEFDVEQNPSLSQ